MRTHGSHLIVCREEALQPNEAPAPVELVRLSWIGGGQYGLSARDWRGKRWERMPFAGSLTDLLDLLQQMPYLIAPIGPPNEQAGA